MKIRCMVVGHEWFPSIVRERDTTMRCIGCGATTIVQGQVRHPIGRKWPNAN